jgi:hypothetical protein
MTIVAGGDSFVFGHELKDCGKNPSKNTFTALLGADVCVARGGYSNSAIARTVMSECSQHQDNLGVIVSWTFSSRFEFRFAYSTGQVSSPWYSVNAWTIENNFENIKSEFVTENEAIFNSQVETIKRAQSTGVQDFAKTFYKHVGSTEYWEIYTTLKEIVLLQNYLKLRQIPYMFTCADNQLVKNYTVDNADVHISALYNQIDFDHWFWFPEGHGSNQTEAPRGFYQWAVENKYPVGTTHPLEQAHQDASTLMQGKFNELVTKHIQSN